MIRRRVLLALAGMAAVPLSSFAQNLSTRKRLGVLIAAQGEARLHAVLNQMALLGWSEGKNLEIVARLTESNPEEIKRFADELIRLAPNAILAGGTAAVAALLASDHSIPVVFATVGDPVSSGFVKSLARPGGRATGFLSYEQSLGGKWVQLLNEIVPSVRRIAALYHPPTTALAGDYYLQTFEASVRALGKTSATLPVYAATDIDDIFAGMDRSGKTGVVIFPSPFSFNAREAIASAALRYKLPTVSPYRDSVSAGGLASYGVEMVHEYEQAARYVARIFGGQKPADLPVQQPMKFDLVLNLRTARQLGVDLAPMLLSRADEVIE